VKDQFVGRSAFEAADEKTRLEVFEYVVQRMREKLAENYMDMNLDYDEPSSRRRKRSSSRKRGESDLEDGQISAGPSKKVGLSDGVTGDGF
jgi:hypothetical protein